MYKCNHCNITIPDNQADGHIVKVGPKNNPKFYCVECGEPVTYIPDVPKIEGIFQGAQATLISNSDNRITTNNYYGGMPDEQIETPFGACKKSETQFCKNCRQWVPMTYFNTDQGLCDICFEKESRKAFDEGNMFYEMGLYNEALVEFNKYESVCKKTEILVQLQYQIGRCYFELKRWNEAIKYFIKSRDQVTESLFYMGLCFYNGYGIPKNLDNANIYIRKAAELGNQEAKDFCVAAEQQRLQDLANKATIEFGNNHYSESRRLWEKAVKQGFHLSAYDINCVGVCYWHEKDYNKSLDYFSRAAEMGRADGAYNWGYMYDHGIGINPNQREAINLYKKSAESGCITAKYALAHIYDNGDGAYRKHDEAVRLLKIVASSSEDDIEKELKFNLIRKTKENDDEEDDELSFPLLSPEGEIKHIIVSAKFDLDFMDSRNK